MMFKPFYLIIRPQHLFLIFLQIGCDKPFSSDKCLLSYIVLRGIMNVCLCNLNVVPEDPVVADLQGVYARPLPFLCLKPCNPSLPLTAYFTQFIEITVITISDNAAVCD